MKCIACLIAAVVLLLAGCATPQSRIKNHPEMYAGLAPTVQAAVQEGHIGIGFSEDAVFLARGRPHRTYQRTTTAGEASVWSYVAHDYVTDRQEVPTTYRVRDHEGRTRTVHDTVSVDVRHEREYETLRIEFQDHTVTAIERISDR